MQLMWRPIKYITFSIVGQTLKTTTIEGKFFKYENLISFSLLFQTNLQIIIKLDKNIMSYYKPLHLCAFQ
jgi:hypothetical protein